MTAKTADNSIGHTKQSELLGGVSRRCVRAATQEDVRGKARVRHDDTRIAPGLFQTLGKIALVA